MKPIISQNEPLEPIRKFRTAKNYNEYYWEDFGTNSDPNDVKIQGIDDLEKPNILNSR